MKTKPIFTLLKRRPLKKLFLKFALFTVCMSFMSFDINKSFFQNTEILVPKSIKLSVEEVFDLIDKHTNHTFIYKSDLFSDLPDIQIHQGAISVESLLHKALKNTSLDFKFIEDGSILIKKSTLPILYEETQKVITGTIVDASGVPIIGASIVEKGSTTKYTVSDFDGKFTLTVEEGTVLEISHLAYFPLEIIVGNDSHYHIVLRDDIGSLDEVVITGYTGYRRDQTPSAITTVNAAEINQVSAGSFNQILQGKVPGMRVISSSGQPGDAPSVVIRGVGTINGSSRPLYIVDDVPVEANYFQTINPNDIESFTVLKDASAKALYGSRGSNGVIIIKTKTGKKGEVRFEYGSQFGVSKKGVQKFQMMNTEERLRFEEEVGLEIGRDIGPGWTYSPKNPIYTNKTPEDQHRADFILDSIRGIDIDWRDMFFRVGQYVDHNVSASGGGEKMTFFNSLNYHDQEGIVKNTGLTRLSLRSNLGYEEGKFSANMNISLGYSKSKFTYNEGGTGVGSPLASVYYALPYENPFGPNGELHPTETDGMSFLDTREGSRGLDVLYNTSSKTEHFKSIVGTNLNYQITPELSVLTRVGVDFRSSVDEDYINPNSYIGSRDVSATRGGRGAFGEGMRRNFSFVSTSGVNYSNTIDEMHDFDLSAFYEYNHNRYRSFNYTGFGLDDRLGGTPASVSVNSGYLPNLGGGRTSSSLASIMGVGRYTFDQKYTLTASYRYDGSSKVVKKNRWHGFYSVGANWNLKREAFLIDNQFIPVLTFRTSYGQTASEFGGDFLYLPTYSVGTFYGPDGGIRPSAPGNPDFDWEYVNEFNIGFDIALFRGQRIHLSTDFYNRITNNMFIDQPLSATSGFSGSVPLSSGKMRNRGVEVDLNGAVIQSPDFSWNVGLNFAYNQNEILHVTDKTDELPDGSTRIIKKGWSYGTYMAPRWAGVDPETGDALYYTKDGQITTEYDDEKLSVPLNASFIPKLVGGINTSAHWKNFSLSTLFSFVADVKRWNNEDFYTETERYMTSNQSNRMLYDRWKNPGDQTILQRIDIPRNYSSKDIQDASYVRLRNIKLSYSLEQSILNKINFINNLTVYAEGTNLYTWTKFRGLDPETDLVYGRFSYPSPRTYTIGINIDF